MNSPAPGQSSVPGPLPEVPVPAAAPDPAPDPAQPGLAAPPLSWFNRLRLHLPTVPNALAALVSLIVVTLFLHTFVLQPYLIPSESMEHTLLVGDFLLFNKQVYAPAGHLGWLLPYRPVERGDIIVFHHPNPPLLVKRVVGLPGDRLRIEDGQVYVNGSLLEEPYATYEPAPPDNFRDNFPARLPTDPQVDPDWWRQMETLTRNGELTVPPGEYFVMGDNRNHSLDSRYWGFVPRQAIVARPLVIYFSLTRPSTTDVQPVGQQASDDRLGHERELALRLYGFARWNRIFRVVR
ncbi:MAG TPA: signal peptidase I [Terracidiphilus sp.]|nr:signal peptidase I [Terracidiphilus sp.]